MAIQAHKGEEQGGLTENSDVRVLMISDVLITNIYGQIIKKSRAIINEIQFYPQNDVPFNDFS